MRVFIAILVCLLVALSGSLSALAEESYGPVSIEELVSAPEKFEGKIITGGYLQLVGYSHYWEPGHRQRGEVESDVASATYKLWTDSEFKGDFIYVVVEDRNHSGEGENPPVAPKLVEKVYYELSGDWAQRNHVASPEVPPGSSMWSLRAHGFD